MSLTVLVLKLKWRVLGFKLALFRFNSLKRKTYKKKITNKFFLQDINSTSLRCTRPFT